MQVRFAMTVLVATVALSACGGGETPVETVTPTPWPGSVTTESTPTPSQEELSAEAERTYRAFFDEWVRLERLGGADEPTQALLDNGAGTYLEGVMALLQDQKAQGHWFSGPLPIAYVRPTPENATDGADPRLTLRVCEDGSASTVHFDGGTQPGATVNGTVYLDYVDDRMKVVAASAEVVETCDLD